MTIRDASKLLRSKEISVKELVQQSLAAAERDAHLNAFITITADQALRRAEELDEELRQGQDRGPLHGIPIGFKDLCYTRGTRTTNGSKLFTDFVPDYNATVVERLEAAGAISIGKLNQHEIAYGITSSNPWFGHVRNPWNPECIPGGSSGGSGVAVAAGSIFCGIGSDTGGSIRCPAAFCGTVGIKPTFGRVSRHGCFPLGLSLDTVGPLTRSVADAAVVLGVIAGPDLRDDATLRHPAESFVVDRTNSLEGVRLGVPDNFYTDRLHPDVASMYKGAIRTAEELGARITAVTVPDPEGLNVLARVTLLCEATAVMRPYLHRREELGKDVMGLLDQGGLVGASEYISAQRLRRSMQVAWDRMFRDVDALVTPCSPVPAPRIGQSSVTVSGVDEDTRIASTKYLRGVNVLGLPAIAIPCGLTSDPLPVGLQIIGSAWSEQRLIAYASALERALPAVRLPG
ncbi:MAG: amidase [Bryobacteraceae bacterium]|nr:amidase [Bryobacteraceae bacterium]